MKHLVDKTILVPFREELKYAVCIVSGYILTLCQNSDILQILTQCQNKSGQGPQ